MRLAVKELACVRSGRVVFEGLSFAVGAGEALVVRGPNGAGKSSLLRILAGLLPAAGGQIDFETDEAERSRGLAAHFVGHLDGVKGASSVAENLDFAQALLGGGVGIEGALSALGLEKLASFPARVLSAGQRRRVALARLLVAPRRLWLLDEPMTALDQEGQETLLAITAAHLAAGGLAVVASHATLKIERSRELRLGTGART